MIALEITFFIFQNVAISLSIPLSFSRHQGKTDVYSGEGQVRTQGCFLLPGPPPPPPPISSTSYKVYLVLTAMPSKLISMHTIIIFFTGDHLLMNDVDNNLYYKKHMLNLQPSLLNFGLKKRKWTAVTGTDILCLIIAETIISAVTGLLVTGLCNNRHVSGGPVFFANSFWMSRKPS